VTQLEAAVLGLKAKEIFQTKAFTQSNYERGRTMIVKGGFNVPQLTQASFLQKIKHCKI